MSLYVKSLPTREGDTFALASLSELAEGLADAIQCPMCDKGQIVDVESIRNWIGQVRPCDNCTNGRLDEKALEAAASVFEAAYDGVTMTDELWQAIKHHGDYEDLMRAMRAGVDAYLEALQEVTDD